MNRKWLSRCGAAMAVLGGLTLAAARNGGAEAAKNIPLKYRLTLNVQDEVGYGGQMLPPKDRSALNLASEPAYVSGEPLYFSVKIGAARDDIYTLVFDASGADTGYDTLYVDADQDGRITADERVASGRKERWSRQFGPVRLMVNCVRNGKKERCPQHLLFRLREFETSAGDGKKEMRRDLQVVNCGYYLARLPVGKTTRTVAFVDGDGNGLYNDYATDGWSGDRIVLDVDRGGTNVGAPDDENWQPLGRYLLLGDTYYRVDIAPDGADLKIAPLDRPSGIVRVPFPETTLLLSSADSGVLRARAKGGQARVPVGQYHLILCSYETKDRKGARWRFDAQGAAGTAGRALGVTSGKAATLPFGPPLHPKVSVRVGEGRELQFDLALTGAGGEVYRNVVVGQWQQPPVPKVRLVDERGKQVAQMDFHYG